MGPAYEGWCWSTHASLWKCDGHVREVNRPKFELCLDNAQVAGGE